MKDIYTLPCKPGSVYINFGRDCLNDCRFCVSRFGKFFGYILDKRNQDDNGNLNEIIKNLKKLRDRCDRLRCKPKEIVICGVGEPFLHYNAVIEVCKLVRMLFSHDVTIRADTAGLWWGKNKDLSLLDYIDSLSVSLNAESEDIYNRICLPKIHGAYGILFDFLETLSKERVRREQAGSKFPDVRLTVIDTSERKFLPPRRDTDPVEGCPVPDFEKCKDISDSLGFPLIIKRLFKDVHEDCWNAHVIEERLLKGEYMEGCRDCNHKHI